MSKRDRNIVIIDDDRDFSKSLVELLQLEGYAVTAFYDANIALRQIDSSFDGVILLDIRMPELSGEEVLLQLMQKDSALPVIHITGHADIPAAVNALKHGAYSFFSKPLEVDFLLKDINNAMKGRHTEIERRYLENQLLERDNLSFSITGASPKIEALRKAISTIGKSDVDVLIRGETGSGKEVVAKALVQQSNRANDVFLAVNCGHLTHFQATEELFGLETLLSNGEISVRQGQLERAVGGTLLLDEIECMPLEMQSRLLRVLQERSFERINGSASVPLDIRVIATTKVNLNLNVSNNLFRQDLYYRLSGIELDVPPLRERHTDSVMLFMQFLSESGHATEISPGLISDILSHDWPGNVRELRNAANRFSAGLSVFAGDDAKRKNSLAARVSDFEKGLIEASLTQNEGSVKRTMLDLDVPRKTLYDKMNKHGIRKDKFSSDK